MNDIKIKINREPWGDKISFALFCENKKFTAIAKPLEFEKLADGEYVGPLGVINHADAQYLFNELWQMGFRPSDGTGNSGHIAAITYHLEDMRRLIFNKDAQQ